MGVVVGVVVVVIIMQNKSYEYFAHVCSLQKYADWVRKMERYDWLHVGVLAHILLQAKSLMRSEEIRDILMHH